MEERIVQVFGSEKLGEVPQIHDGEMLPLLPLRNRVLFPGILLPVTISRAEFKDLVKRANKNHMPIGVCTQTLRDVDRPEYNDMYHIGTVATVLQVMNVNEDNVMAVLEGGYRFIFDNAMWVNDGTSPESTLVGKVRLIGDELIPDDPKTFELLCDDIRDMSWKLMHEAMHMPEEALGFLKNVDDPAKMLNYVCVNYECHPAYKTYILRISDMEKRAELLLRFLRAEKERFELKQEIEQKTRQNLSEQQRSAYLQQQLQTINEELGNDDHEYLNELAERAKKAKLPEHAMAAFEKSLSRLERIQNNFSAEYDVELTYIETLLDLPWNQYTGSNTDIKRAQEILDADHYGMPKVKERVLEYMSLIKRVGIAKSPILCFVGAPGIGKTSLGKSIANALGRKYVRISLGGVHDEAEIRGHRRTYIGAMPGRILQNLRKVKSNDPVVILDEIDKVGSDHRSDPTSALLEVLDPEQNNTFHDNYIDLDYDLSHILFIATANNLEDIPAPLRDRMEIIHMDGYSTPEKLEIAKRHIIPKQLEINGLTEEQYSLSDEVLEHIIEYYTAESGVRGLEKRIAQLCRMTIKKIELEQTYSARPSIQDIQADLGLPTHNHQTYAYQATPGIATGLAWTSVGGETLRIEAAIIPSDKPAENVSMTGNLGDIIKESAIVAMQFIRSHAEKFGLNGLDVVKKNIHLHFPEGATPKDGPSAGITITTAILSALLQKPVREGIAMTGEITLTGKVLPVGGIKEKILAAKRENINEILLSKENERDIKEIEPQYLDGMTFKYYSNAEDVLKYAIAG